MPKIGIGLIGGGYMGKRHAVALTAAPIIFNTKLKTRLEMICTTNQKGAAQKAQALGFFDFTHNWWELVHNPAVDAVVIASPQATHRDIALECFRLGKPVFCEKPLGASLEDALIMTEAAHKANVMHMIGFNYIRTPATQCARQLIQDGLLGEITFFRGEHSEDFYANPLTPASWRSQGRANGALGDLAPHLINCAQYLLGDIDSLSAQIETVYPTRPCPESAQTHRAVTNDDIAQFLCRFKQGYSGHLCVSRVATGRKMGLIYEITGTKGALRFNQEDQNSLWLYQTDDPPHISGFRQILTGPAHPDYDAFCLGPGHGTGYQDQIIIEIRDFLDAVYSGQTDWPQFDAGLAVAQVIEAVHASHDSGKWVKVSS